MKQSLTVSELCRKFLENRDGLVKESSFMRYKKHIDNHIIPFLDEIQAKDLTQQQVEDFYKMRIADGLSENFVHDLGVLLRSIFKYGEKYYDIVNIPEKVDLVRMHSGKVQTLSDKNIVKVLRYGELPEKIALCLGLRIGEVCGIMGQDYREGIISIKRTVQRLEKREGGTQLHISTPKSADSQRKIPVPKHLRDIFSKAADDEYILGGRTPTDPRTVTYRWKRFCEEYGIEHIKFHALRHTFATKALECGMDVKTLSDILGHSNVSITMNLYCHPSEKHKAESMKKLWEGMGINIYDQQEDKKRPV